jgi:1-acyl-sn-glycerol-3-phosphate acyltransferase
MLGNVRIVLVLFGLVLALLLLLPLQLIALVFARFGMPKASGYLPLMFHRVVLRLAGIRLTVDGTLPAHRPLLIVSNHVSWLDIVILGAVQPLSFVAKSEMLTWPLFGKMAQLQRTVFIQRERRRQSANQANAIAERMAAQETMVLFPEGTTTDGNMLLPFKTPLFEAARYALVASSVEEALVQPVAIVYSHLHGLPIGRAERPHVAWPGDIGLGESLFPILRMGALDVTVRLGDPIVFTENSKRKIVSAEATAAIGDMLLKR